MSGLLLSGFSRTFRHCLPTFGHCGRRIVIWGGNGGAVAGDCRPHVFRVYAVLLSVVAKRLAALVVVILAGSAPPAQAQSFFEKLFGLSGGANRPAAQPPIGYGYRAPLHTPQSRSEPSRSEDTSSRKGKGWRVRTMCVRLCDGYYFPMSQSTTTRGLTVDSRRCKSSCGSAARLFYMDADSTDAAAMTDFTGRRYDALDTAFDYRKKLTPGCSCKPAPWSAAERLRHINYALRDAMEQAKARAAAEAKLAAAAPLPEKAPATRVASTQSDNAAVDTGASSGIMVPSRASSQDGQSTAVESGMPLRVPVPAPMSNGFDSEAHELAASPTDAAHASNGSDEPEDDTARMPRRNSGGVVRRRAPSHVAREERHSQPKPRYQAARHSGAKPPSGGGIFGIGGGSNYVWPGDRR